jgi:hypothetical protein
VTPASLVFVLNFDPQNRFAAQENNLLALVPLYLEEQSAPVLSASDLPTVDWILV